MPGMEGPIVFTQPKTEPPVRFANKDELNRLMDEIEERMGFVPDPEATIEKLREMLLAEGVRPEENALTGELLRMRYGDE
jgi:hypothetical protein